MGPAPPNDARIAALAFWLAQDGKPYIWGCAGEPGWDCSHLYNAGVRAGGGPDWVNPPHERRAQTLWERLRPPPWSELKPGDACFYTDATGQHVIHVAVWWGDGRVFDASGGDSTTTSIEAALRRTPPARVGFHD